MAKITYVDGEGVERYVKTGRSVLTIRASRERWRKANLEKQRERNNRWRVTNPEKQSAAERRWQDANPDIVRAKRSRHKHKRRTVLKERKPEIIDAAFLRLLRKAQKDTCAYCPTKLRGAGELDHIIPVSKGGRHSKCNIVWACVPCNRKKSDKIGWTPVNRGVGPQEIVRL